MKNAWLLPFLIIAAYLPVSGQTKNSGKNFTGAVQQDSCSFSPAGRNNYFILEPGYQLILEGKEAGKASRLVITVLNETRNIAGVETRVVEENESVNGKTTEISKNFFALCRQSGSIYYFGEEVDIYKNGKVISHEGAWKAGGKNKAGIVMPGVVMTGAKYYQEMAPGIAMDRAAIITLEETLETPAGKFTNCLKTEESTPLDKKEKEFKIYASGIGLIKEENLLLVKYGFIK
jgi:hypothetical protein